MKFNKLHAWNVDYKKAIQIQQTLRDLLIIKKSSGKIDTIAGADVSYDKQSDYFFAGVIVFTLNKYLEQIEEATAIGKARFPYIPGLLSFREAPILLKAFRKLKNEPDIILFDGQGIAHPRHLGLASHMGLILDKPTIGCAKSRLVGEYSPVENAVGSYTKLLYKNEVVGAALRTKINTKPVFISPGHKTNLAFAIRIVMASCYRYRIPEPIRQAHLLVNKLRKESHLQK
ncbi:MAG: endonuclease V [Candidatus Jettenia sp.]|uniref:Endonuclease V n=1 Tax=Candidatus Jettenia caeni TaxID=247490 RepID=I3IQH5_9BACT|nr:deoxyribonuclease V [Candidatus Jettenia sp. AMX1]MBC6928597.1 endonuclease V [Candidatus Jettenia sp.]NUN22902.1 endonuclease V [Candidatus Jettenia caeni]KAA0249854.1 MAG: endonuclease V [Candidatus Jettenia sp. AMX1]MCE7880618.1 endonuclease V [Candidatus Jettenia sp. AMX1]MCQ3927230.1 endonuclease V [Candidatus Jettenia sp.]